MSPNTAIFGALGLLSSVFMDAECFENAFFLNQDNKSLTTRARVGLINIARKDFSVRLHPTSTIVPY